MYIGSYPHTTFIFISSFGTVNGIIQIEINPILTKQFLGERQDKNSIKKIEKVSFKRRKR
jgi:hypothetical protein